jgi:hypothetical protein
MKKGIFFVVTIAFSFLFLSTAFSANKKSGSGQNEWEIYSESGAYAGLLKKEDGKFIFYDKNTISLEETEKGVWAMYDQARNYMGTVKRYKDSSFKLYDKNERYLGIILSSKNFRPSGAQAKKITSGKIVDKKYDYAKTSPEAIKIYLYCLEALDTSR